MDPKSMRTPMRVAFAFDPAYRDAAAEDPDLTNVRASPGFGTLR